MKYDFQDKNGKCSIVRKNSWTVFGEICGYVLEEEDARRIVYELNHLQEKLELLEDKNRKINLLNSSLETTFKDVLNMPLISDDKSMLRIKKLRDYFEDQ